MPGRYREFNRASLKLKPIAQREHDLDLSVIRPLEPIEFNHGSLIEVADKIISAKSQGASVILMMGAHVLRDGVQKYIIDLMEKGFISCIAMNGAGVIHDFEFALIGATTENVANYIKDGSFGNWEETSIINDIVSSGAKKLMGLGEAVGKFIEEENLPNRDISLLAAGYRLNLPVTVHVGIGCDIVHQHPNCDGAAYGAASYTDFLRFAGILESLEGGVVMNFGSSVTAPEVYLKALSMVRNAAGQNGKSIKRFSTLVCDQLDLPDNFHAESPKSDHRYYFRPWKTMLVRTVADGGESYYVKGRHKLTIPALWNNIISKI